MANIHSKFQVHGTNICKQFTAGRKNPLGSVNDRPFGRRGGDQGALMWTYDDR